MKLAPKYCLAAKAAKSTKINDPFRLIGLTIRLKRSLTLVRLSTFSLQPLFGS
jgi:hypothetical protein